MTLTVADVSQAVPANLKSAVTQQFVDTINNVVADPDVAQQVRDNFITYASVLRDGKYKMQDYLNAVTYTSFKMMDMSNHDAWCSTFPQRYQALVAAGKSKKDISSHVSMYAKGKLVAAVAEASFIPTWILNRDIQQKAINRLAELMMNAASEKVQAEAASSLLTHLAKPKDAVPQVAIQINQNTGMNELLDTLSALAEKQVNLIDQGVTAKDLAAQKLGKRVN